MKPNRPALAQGKGVARGCSLPVIQERWTHGKRNEKVDAGQTGGTRREANRAQR